MKHMILSSKMKGNVISDHFLMLWFQKDSLDTIGFRVFRRGHKNILMDWALRPSLSASIEELMKDGSGGSCSQDKPGQANRLFDGMAYKDISSR